MTENEKVTESLHQNMEQQADATESSPTTQDGSCVNLASEAIKKRKKQRCPSDFRRNRLRRLKYERDQLAKYFLPPRNPDQSCFNSLFKNSPACVNSSPSFSFNNSTKNCASENTAPLLANPDCSFTEDLNVDSCVSSQYPQVQVTVGTKMTLSSSQHPSKLPLNRTSHQVKRNQKMTEFRWKKSSQLNQQMQQNCGSATINSKKNDSSRNKFQVQMTLPISQSPTKVHPYKTLRHVERDKKRMTQFIQKKNAHIKQQVRQTCASAAVNSKNNSSSEYNYQGADSGMTQNAKWNHDVPPQISQLQQLHSETPDEGTEFQQINYYPSAEETYHSEQTENFQFSGGKNNLDRFPFLPHSGCPQSSEQSLRKSINFQSTDQDGLKRNPFLVREKYSQQCVESPYPKRYPPQRHISSSSHSLQKCNQSCHNPKHYQSSGLLERNSQKNSHNSSVQQKDSEFQHDPLHLDTQRQTDWQNRASEKEVSDSWRDLARERESWQDLAREQEFRDSQQDWAREREFRYPWQDLEREREFRDSWQDLARERAFRDSWQDWVREREFRDSWLDWVREQEFRDSWLDLVREQEFRDSWQDWARERGFRDSWLDWAREREFRDSWQDLVREREFRDSWRDLAREREFRDSW